MIRESIQGAAAHIGSTRVIAPRAFTPREAADVSEPEINPVPAVVEPVASPAEQPEVAALNKSVRRLTIWLVILTVVVGLTFVCVGGAIVVSVAGFGGFVSDGISQGELDTETPMVEIKNALGDKLESADVRSVTIDYGDEVPFPFGLMGAGMDEQSLYVEIHLKDSDVVIAGVLNGMYGDDLLASGVLPTKGSLTSRMTDEQFKRILDAYAAETKLPLGSVRRYNDVSSEMAEPGTAVPETVIIGNKKFKSAELWSAVEGTLVKGDTLKLSGTSFYENGPKAFVFHEDPETGEFTFLGTESTQSVW
jgi:hypothetical protein